MRGRAQRLPRIANQVSTAFGENAGLLGLLVACLFNWWMDGWSVNKGGRGWMHAWMHKWVECK